MPLLDGKIALVTGASSGIGRAIALLFAQHGARLVLTARREAELQGLAQQIGANGGRAHVVAGDVTRPDTHDRLIAETQHVFGGLDIAVNNAGTVGLIQPLADVHPEDWQQVLATNLTSAYLGARGQIPALLARGGGALVFTSSFVGTSTGLPGMAAYGAAKAGLVGLVKGITADYAAQGIRANALLPGGTLTALAGDTAQQDWAAGLHTMKRLAEPSEIAAAALFLSSPMASFVTGTALFADGGNAAVK